MTIKTDSSVSEIKLINTDNNTFVTYSSNDVSVEEDGDNLVWTVQNTFSTGSWIYDVAVKADDVWYTTNKVFAITVT